MVNMTYGYMADVVFTAISTKNKSFAYNIQSYDSPMATGINIVLTIWHKKLAPEEVMYTYVLHILGQHIPSSRDP